jgi:plasmid maintenance system antidote protein VapI
MDARAYWDHYVERHHGAVAVAALLDLPYSTVASICNGSRGIGRDLARRISDKEPLLDENVLIWVTAEKKRKAA